MKRRIFFRALIGMPIGVTISTIVLIFISLARGDGKFYAFHPDLMCVFGNEIYTVIIQTACSMLYGAAWGGASAIWDVERWSLTRMTLTHLAVCSFSTLPIAYFMYWMPHSVGGLLLYFGLFFFIYFVIWSIQYIIMKRRIYSMNRQIKK